MNMQQQNNSVLQHAVKCLNKKHDHGLLYSQRKTEIGTQKVMYKPLYIRG